MTDRELMAQAIAALEYHTDQTRPIPNTNLAIEALRARLAQPEPEPVAWMGFETFMDEDGLMSERKFLNTWDNGHGVPLYTAPPQREWQGLTDEECLQNPYCAGENDYEVIQLARAIEAKLKAKNAQAPEN